MLGMNLNKKSFITNYQEIAVPDCHWAYKTFPTTTSISKTNHFKDFIMYLTLDYCLKATPEALKRGLLKKINYR